jgi:DNA-binding MarR family transcriptional regulator
METKRKNEFDRRIESVRRFSRFYTRQIGLLNEGTYGSRFSLTEVRVLYELSRRQRTIATALRHELGLDAGYLSRILRRFENKGLVRRTISSVDGRQSLVSLTSRGRQVFSPLDERSDSQVAVMLKGLPASQQKRLIAAMDAIQQLMSSKKTLA